ncbi:MAG: hypothetical protein NC078_08070 [Ruminococcus sp.]|nr:hypothetical protein [Ruminococcus sp.]
MTVKSAALIFGLAGAVCGVFLCRRFFEEKYKRLADEEIESVKETFAKRVSPTVPADEPADSVAASVKKKVDYSGVKHDGGSSAVSDNIYDITPEQFGEFDDYGKISLVYFSDSVLASDDNYERIVPTRSNVGSARKLQLYFDSEDTDCVYIRNDNVRTDYEIVRDERTYDEICIGRPYLGRE